MRWLNLATLAVCLLSLPGCQSYRSAHNGPVGDQHLYAGNAESMSDCAVAKLNLLYASNWNNYTFSKIRERQTIIVMATAQSMSAKIYAWHLSFIPQGAAHTRVEVRSTKNIWGSYNYPDDIWETVDQCGQRA